MSTLDNLINSNLPKDLVNSILFYAHPRMELKLQNQIKTFKFKKYGLMPLNTNIQSDIIAFTYNYNILRIFSGMGGFAIQ